MRELSELQEALTKEPELEALLPHWDQGGKLTLISRGIGSTVSCHVHFRFQIPKTLDGLHENPLFVTSGEHRPGTNWTIATADCAASVPHVMSRLKEAIHRIKGDAQRSS